MAAHPFRPIKHERIKKLSRQSQDYDLVKELADLKVNVKSLDKILSSRTPPSASGKKLSTHFNK